MAETPVCDFGAKAPDFKLRGTDGKDYALSDLRGEKGTKVIVGVVRPGVTDPIDMTP